MNQIWLAFLTGLTTGGISCMAVQGGLLASSILTNATKNDRFLNVGVFLVFKIIAYTLLGTLLGCLGSTFIISPTLQGWFQVFVGLFMLATAGRLLNLHPIFRYFVIQPPKWIYKILKNQSKVQSIFTPGILGFLTILIPCGVTQAMMVIAVGSGSPLVGGLTMLAFTLGTSPVFFTLGVAASHLMKKKAFNWAAASIVAILGILSVNTGQVLRGSPHTIQNYYSIALSLFNQKATATSDSVAGVVNGSQEVEVQVTSRGYSASVNTIKAGVPVRMKLITNNTQ